MSKSRIPEPTEADYRRLEKYKKALDYLTAEIYVCVYMCVCI